MKPDTPILAAHLTAWRFTNGLIPVDQAFAMATAYRFEEAEEMLDQEDVPRHLTYNDLLAVCR